MPSEKPTPSPECAEYLPPPGPFDRRCLRAGSQFSQYRVRARTKHAPRHTHTHTHTHTHRRAGLSPRRSQRFEFGGGFFDTCQEPERILHAVGARV